MASPRFLSAPGARGRFAIRGDGGRLEPDDQRPSCGQDLAAGGEFEGEWPSIHARAAAKGIGEEEDWRPLAWQAAGALALRSSPPLSASPFRDFITPFAAAAGRIAAARPESNATSRGRAQGAAGEQRPPEQGPAAAMADHF